MEQTPVDQARACSALYEYCATRAAEYRRWIGVGDRCTRYPATMAEYDRLAQRALATEVAYLQKR